MLIKLFNKKNNYKNEIKNDIVLNIDNNLLIN
jgi:hypothetical protein